MTESETCRTSVSVNQTAIYLPGRVVSAHSPATVRLRSMRRLRPTPGRTLRPWPATPGRRPLNRRAAGGSGGVPSRVSRFQSRYCPPFSAPAAGAIEGPVAMGPGARRCLRQPPFHREHQRLTSSRRSAAPARGSERVQHAPEPGLRKAWSTRYGGYRSASRTHHLDSQRFAWGKVT